MKAVSIGICMFGVLVTSQTFGFDSRWATIDKLKAYPNQLMISLDDTHGCGGTAGNTMYRIDQSAEVQVSVAIAAFLAGRQVQVDFNCAASGQPAGAYTNIIVTE